MFMSIDYIYRNDRTEQINKGKINDFDFADRYSCNQ